MYHVAGTVVTITILYLVSAAFQRSGLYNKNLHRKFWNYILAASFLFTALAGLFLAVQANMKWNVPIIERILEWHVEIGAVLATTGIFHFLWNISYYIKPSVAPGETKSEAKNGKGWNKETVLTNLFITGLVSTSVQFLLIREIMNISGGYELITGILLSSWLLSSATGAYLARKGNGPGLKQLNLQFSLAPLLSLSIMIILIRLFLYSGESPSFSESAIFTIITIFPYCLISGYLFIRLLSTALEFHKTEAGKSYAVETAGGVIAGIILSILTSGMVNTYSLFLLAVILSLYYTLSTYYFSGKKTAPILKVMFVFLSLLALSGHSDRFFRKLLMPGVDIRETTDTPYGNISTGIYAGDTTLYYNHRVINYSLDVSEREETIHYAMLQTNNAKDVVLISGPLQSSLTELDKYPLSRITFVERDPLLTEMAASNSSCRKSDIIIANSDAYTFIRNYPEKADAVIMDLPEPSTLSVNRFYTTEFFGMVRDILNDQGVFICSPGPSDPYLNEASIKLLSSVYNSLRSEFLYVKPVMGTKLFFIASDRPVLISFGSLADSIHLQNFYVNSGFLSDDLIAMKSDEIEALMDEKIPQNRIMYPAAVFYSQSYFLSRGYAEKTPLIGLILVLFALPAVLFGSTVKPMYFNASALAGFEIITLALVQISAGNIYQMTSMILAVAMAGLAAGSAAELRILKKLNPAVICLITAIFLSIFALLTDYLPLMENVRLVYVAFLFTLFIPSFLTGLLFRKMTFHDTGGGYSQSVYSSDLAGSATGFILTAGLLVPVMGIKNTVFILAGLNFTGFLVGLKHNKY